MSEIYFSVDIETDGPIPGQNSMLSLGAVALDGHGNELSTYTVNFTELPGARPDPDTMEWWAKQPAAVVEAARGNPQNPRSATVMFREWVESVAGERSAKPVFVDIDPRTYTMDVTRIEAAITSRTPGTARAFDASKVFTLAPNTGGRATTAVSRPGNWMSMPKAARGVRPRFGRSCTSSPTPWSQAPPRSATCAGAPRRPTPAPFVPGIPRSAPSARARS